jgi:membrane-associated protein
MLHQIVDVVLHLDRHLNEWAGMLGPWLYVLLFVIVFCETGLVVTPFLPGDSLLFAVGAMCSVENATVSLPLSILVLLIAAIVGDAVNYSIGRYLGPAVFKSENSRFLNPKHIERTHAFYAKYGGKTIFLARFVPVVRTFAPFVAGIGQMDYRHFAVWNVTGAAAWVVSLSLAGYFFGQIPIVKQNFETVILGIIVLSLLPMLVEFLRARRSAAKA